MTNSSEGLALIRTQNTLSRILYDKQLVAIGNVHDSIHITCNARIMHRNNNLGFLSYCPFNGIRIDIHRIRTYIDEHQGGAYHLKCRSSG